MEKKPQPIPERMSIKLISRRHPYLAEIARQHAGMAELAILQGDKQRAASCIEMAFAALEERYEVLPATPIDSIFDDKLAAALIDHGYYTVGQVCAESKSELSKKVGFRSIAIEKLERCLKKHGWSLQ